MALIAKTAAPIAPPSLVQARPAASAYRAAVGAGDGPVDGLTAAAGTDLDFAVSQFPDQDDRRPGSGQDSSDNRGRLPGPPRAEVRTPTEAFAALIELDGAFETNEFDAPRANRRPADAAGLARAVSTYEVNERVIYGTEARTGEQVSISL
jgi:hypothetical protein